MGISKEAWNFNKEILFGEIGALIGAPTFGVVASHYFSNPQILSSSAVIGAIIGASLFFLSMRIYDKSKQKNFSEKSFVKDLAFFTPAAFILTTLVYYPSLFFISEYLIESQFKIVFSVILSQFVAFAFFLISINLYRYILLKLTGRKL